MFNPKGYTTFQGYTGFLPDGRRICFPTQVKAAGFELRTMNWMGHSTSDIH